MSLRRGGKGEGLVASSNSSVKVAVGRGEVKRMILAIKLCMDM